MVRHAAVLIACLAAAGGCGKAVDDLFCTQGGGCFFTATEWAQIRKLSPLGLPPLDPSNRLIGKEDAVQMGWRLYWDGSLSGVSTWQDQLGRTTPSARSPLNTPVQISCATCHDPGHAGTDITSLPGNVSVGAGWYDVNAQQTVNAAYYKLMYWNGRADSLWSQAVAVMESNISMNGRRLAILWTIASNPAYRACYDKIVGPDQALPLPAAPPDCAALTADSCTTAAGCFLDPASATPSCLPLYPTTGKTGGGCKSSVPGCPLATTVQASIDQAYANVAKIIAAYEYELRSRNSPFDELVARMTGASLAPDGAAPADGGGSDGPADAGVPTPAAPYPDAALRGLKLFVSRASCIDCHNTPLLSDSKFHNIGVPQQGLEVPTESDCIAGSPCDCTTLASSSCLPWGYYTGWQKLVTNPFNRKGGFSDDPDRGASYQTTYMTRPDPTQRDAWRTPSLRDVALTAPYMHDGVYATLDEVIQHYDQGGGAPAGGSKANELSPLLLSDGERSDLVAFLQTLTGKPDRPELHVAPKTPLSCAGSSP
jgi:cytochrome c peroxidase